MKKVQNLEKLRQVLVEELKKYNGVRPIALPFAHETTENLIFSYYKNGYKKFADSLDEVLSKIDFNNISFDKFDAVGVDFSKYKGIKINPQTLSNKSLYCAKVSGVEFIGPFDGVDVRFTNFTGSKNPIINPETTKYKSLHATTLNEVEFIGSFNGVDITSANFTGSYNAKVNPQMIRNKSLCDTVCRDVEFIGPFDGVNMISTNLEGSSNAKVNPQTIKDKFLYNTNLIDADIIGSFNGIIFGQHDFSGFIVIDSKKKVKSLIRK